MHDHQGTGAGTEDGEVAGAPGFRRDRFMIDGADTGGRLSRWSSTRSARGSLAGPLHFHTREDEFSFVLEGRLGALLGDQEVVAGPGDLVFKPRGQWHTFWNAGEETTRILELITPAGLEDLFRELGALGDDFDPATLPAMAEAYGCQVDFEGTAAVIERYGLRF